MKIKLFALALVVMAALPFAACAQPTPPQPDGVTWEVSYDNFVNTPHLSNDVVHVPAGADFDLILGSNPTTGFSWSETAQISDAAVLKQVSHEYIASSGDMAGAAGREVWKFQTLQKGETTVHLEYGRPWEGGEKAEWTYTVTVNVE